MADEKKLTLEDVEKFDLKDIESLTDAQVEELDGPMQAAIKDKIGMNRFRDLIMGEGRTKARLRKAAEEKGISLKNAGGSTQEIKAGIAEETKTPPPAKKDPDPKESDSDKE